MNEEQIKALIAASIGEFTQKTLPGILTGALGPIGDQLKSVADKLEKGAPAPPAPAPTPTPAPAPTPTPAPAPAPAPGVDPTLNAAMLEMKRTMEAQAAEVKRLSEEAATAKKQADEAQRKSAIESALGEFSFARPSARDTAMQLISGQVKRLDDGTLVAGNNLPVADFVKDFISNEHAYLLASTGASGAGVTPGSVAAGSKPVAIEDIKPGMTPEQRSAAWAQIQQHLQPR